MRRALLLLALAAGCTHPAEPASPQPDPAQPPPAAPPPAAAPAELDARFVPLVAAAFRDYKAWGRVDDELRWAPWLCRMPMPGRARMSAADEGDHARKLYSVFAKHQDRYPLSQGGDRVDQPAGQVLIKESYHPEPVEGSAANVANAVNAAPGDGLGEGDHFDPHARDGDRVYRASRMVGVYVVMKLPPGTPGTDAGWIYGTVTPAGEVTSAGKVASCMGCHVSARHERVFGLNPAPAAAR